MNRNHRLSSAPSRDGHAVAAWVVLPSVRAARAALAVVVALLGLALFAQPALADGPGYGGTADKLAVSWASGPTTQAAGSTAAAPQRVLHISGVGFRNLSQVSLRVSANSNIATRVDAAGTLSAAVSLPANSPDITGTSVVASGRAPSGTSLTLVGSVPPVPSGMSPAQVVPWVAAIVGLVLLGYRVARGRIRNTRLRDELAAAEHHTADLAHELVGHLPHAPVPATT